MDNHHKFAEKKLQSPVLYDSSALKVIILACLIIFISVIATGILSYTISKNAVIDKLKTRDLPNIVQSMSAKIDGRLERAIETSLQLSRDPAVLEWVMGHEENQQLSKYVATELSSLGKEYDYSNSFIVSALTNHYWAENGSLLGTVSPDEPKDVWFYSTLKAQNRVTLNLDYDKLRQDTSVFVNTLMGDLDNPVAVVGVGLSLEEIAREFQNYKFGTESHLWLIDQNGKICLSDQVADDGKNITNMIPPSVSQEILENTQLRTKNSELRVTELTSPKGQLLDLAYQPLQSADWTLVFQIPRAESLAVVEPIRTNTLAAMAITVLLLVVIFYIVSRRIADPYKYALALNMELERQVDLRTQELMEKNKKIMDSIDYAQTIQEAMLPSPVEFSRLFQEHFILWRPRDIVGGDFYWGRVFPHGRLIIVGDCTGHGVPGALMTMAVISMIDHIVSNITQDDPALIINELNRLLGQAFQGDDGNKQFNQGLDAGICYISSDGQLNFAGAKMALYHAGLEGLQVYKGTKRSIGYSMNSERFNPVNNIISYQAQDCFYISTDGYWDQNDAKNNRSFGTRRFREIITQRCALTMGEQGRIFANELEKYMQGEEQRDDITVLGFRL